MENLLDIKNLNVTFPHHRGAVKAVCGVSLHVGKGEIVGIVGESGCGKSVTVQSIILPAGTVEGEIWFEKENLLTKSNSEMQAVRGKKIGMIFQDPMTSLNPIMRVGHQISETLQRHEKLSKAQAQSRSIELMQMVGIAEPDIRYLQYPYEFSGGMRQRVMIAIAMACHPSLIIADEPTTSLDVTIQAQILDLLKGLCRNTGTSLLFITHDFGVVAGLCDRVIVMKAGRIVESGLIDQIFYAPKHPYTKELLKV